MGGRIVGLEFSRWFTLNDVMPTQKIPTLPLSGSHNPYLSSPYLTTITTTVIKFLSKRVWYKNQVFIRWNIRSADIFPQPGAPTTPPSPAARLPQEIVEIVIAQFMYDKLNLLACSLTCRSWYIAAVRHLHHTLTASAYHGHGKKRLRRLDSFRCMHELGLFSLVKKFHIRGSGIDLSGPWSFSSNQFDSCGALRHFSALTNVQELGIDYLDIPSFMPNIQRYFGHFLPMVRSLALRNPVGSRRQVIFFIGLFQHLQDLKLLYDLVYFEEEPVDDLTLIPSFAPLLCGRLTMTCFTRVGILEDMIDLYGGIRFRHMDLFSVHGMRLLLDACAETLETLRLYPIDPRGEEVSSEGVQVPLNNFDFTARSSPEDFDLSRNNSLRALEITSQSIGATCVGLSGLLEASPSLKHALSTITSPAFSEVIVLYQDFDFCYYWGTPPAFFPISQTARAGVASRHHKRFNLFREMYKVRDFRLVLCADVWDRMGKYSVGVLKQAIAVEKAERGLGGLPSELSVTYSPRGYRLNSGDALNPAVLRSGCIRAKTPL